MFEQQPEDLRKKVKQLATEFTQNADPSGWFEVLYADAGKDAKQVPWARLAPHHAVQEWLEKHNPSGNGKSALAIGCGLGDDAEALSRQGFQVTAFDISSSAIAWCKQRFPNSSVNYQVADLFHLDPAWNHAFDLVVEVRNIQALPLKVRSQVLRAIAPLVAPEGTLLIITRIRDTETEPDGPPWALSDGELAQLQQLGLTEIERNIFFEGENDEVKHAQITYRAPR
ncbi:class I SAM-dependent methyltransferase [Lusitaniella coriacea]|uniref:class I SAM-dependent methyltransferase n=1 Tax=Lusitaniella coriacea TaxID=1983105 RepID=UPI003CF88008